MIIWEIHYGKTGHIQNKIIDDETDIMVIAFLTCISTSGYADSPQMGTIQAKEIA